MIKLTFGVSRRADWSHEEWLVHYQERHGPLAAGLKIFGRHCLRYVQNYALTPAYPGAIPNHADAVDGVSELWFDDVAAIHAAYADPGYMALIRPDELSFCDLNAIIGGVGRETTILAEPLDESDKKWINKSRARLLIYRRAATGMTDTGFQQKWLEAAAQISQQASFQNLVRAYVQTHLQNDESPLPSTCPYGVIDEFWFRSDADALAFWLSTRESALIGAIEERLTLPAEALAVFARAHSVFEDTRTG